MSSVYLAELNQHFSYHQVLLLCFSLRFHKNSPEGQVFIPLKITRFLELLKTLEDFLPLLSPFT